MNYVAFSGGKDSTALVLRLAELGESFECLFTPTLDELPNLTEHVECIVRAVDRKIHYPQGPKLIELIQKYNALPNHRQRWCTRQIKIEPCISFLQAQSDPTLSVGLRADEEEREGLYGPFAKYRYPLREWGWGLPEVWAYLRERGIKVPERTDCGCCYGQRLSEWWRLWRKYPDRWAQYEALDAQTGHTFRSPSRDTWPAALKDLRARFEAGDTPRGVDVTNLFAEDCETSPAACRVCRF